MKEKRKKEKEEQTRKNNDRWGTHIDDLDKDAKMNDSTHYI